MTFRCKAATYLIFGLLLSNRCSAASLQIITEETPGRGVAYLRIMVQAGSQNDPQGKEGVASFTATLLKRGTRSFSRQQLDERLDQMGAQLDINVEKEFTLIAGRCLTRNLEAFYGIVKEIILAPTFPAREVQQARQDLLEAITDLKNNNDNLGIEAFHYFLYKGTSWEHAAVGRVSAIRQLSRHDAQNFYKTYYTQQATEIGIGGDYGGAPFVAKVVADFSTLPDKPAPMVVVPHPHLLGRKVLIVEKPGLDQGQINIGHPLALNRHDSSFAPLYIAAHYLGSHRSFTGLLMNSIRSDRGLTYGAYAYIENFPDPYAGGEDSLPALNIARSQQDFRIWTFTLIKNMDFTLRLALHEFLRLLQTGIDRNRFEKVKTYAENKFVFQVETAERRLAMRLDDRIYGLPSETGGFAQHFPQELHGVTRASVNRAMRSFWSGDDLGIVVTVPDAAQFKTALLTPGAAIEYQGGIDPQPLQKEDAAVQQLDLKISAADISIVGVNALFE